MKRILILIMAALVMTASLAACGADSDDKNTEETAKATEKISATQSATQNADPTEADKTDGEKSKAKVKASEAAPGEDDGELPLMPADYDSGNSGGNNSGGNNSGSGNSGGSQSGGSSSKPGDAVSKPADPDQPTLPEEIRQYAEDEDELPFVPA